jgi:hypothetical protein
LQVTRLQPILESKDGRMSRSSVIRNAMIA